MTIFNSSLKKCENLNLSFIFGQKMRANWVYVDVFLLFLVFLTKKNFKKMFVLSVVVYGGKVLAQVVRALSS